VEIVDVSLGGLKACTTEPMSTGDRRVLLATLGPAVTLELRATVAHCAPWAGRPGHYRVGLAFDQDSLSAHELAALIAHLTAVPRLS